ncbi:MAG: Hsp20/alpha crystallin family protein [Bacillota bacterium]|nr:Hsp20/alpha crystallin family protein [Bacillota bacterium]MDI7250111.1 Hsp20/alpha crystallin family protein [Bacillota bacterium]
MSLMRWDPFRDLVEIQRNLEDLFRRTFSAWDQPLAPVRTTGWTPPLDVIQKEGELLIRAELPGVDPEQVEVTVEDDRLTIRGERKEQIEVEKESWLRRELRYGSFERCLTLPAEADTEKIKATYRNGVLEITVPYQPAAKPRRLTIDVEKPKK